MYGLYIYRQEAVVAMAAEMEDVKSHIPGHITAPDCVELKWSDVDHCRIGKLNTNTG